MKIVRTLAILAASVALSAASPPAPAPAPTTVFGMELGKPLAIPMCKRKMMPGGYLSKYTYEDDPAETCYEPDIQLSDAPWRRGSVDFPLSRTPSFLALNTGFTLIVDGKLEGLQFSTLGHANTNAIIGELTAKFGRPSSVSRTTSTISGIAVPAIEAEWRLPTLHVSYRNIDTEVEHGFLEIETTAMHERRSAHQQAQEAGRTRL
jgi:hypothetical protein